MKAMKRTLCLLLVLATMCSLCAGAASAASLSAYDCLSESKYAKVYTIKSSGRVTPFTGPDLNTPGSVGCPSNSAYIDCKNDEIYVYDVGITGGKAWAKISYPLNNKYNRRTAYIYLSEITANSQDRRAVSTGKFLCSPRQGGSLNNSYYIARNDVTWLLDVSGDWVQLLYPTGSNGYRIAWARKADYERCCGATNGMTDVTAQYAGKTIRMKSVENGKYLCADSNHNGTPLMANRTSGSTWETFQTSGLTDDGWIGFKAHNGKYLSVMADTGNTPVCARYDNLLNWEKVRVYQKGNDLYLKSFANSKWFCVRVNESNVPVRADVTAASTWERIRIEIVGNNASQSFWTWPMKTDNNGYGVYQGFNRYNNTMASRYGRPYHLGIDMYCSNKQILAAASGTVIYKGYSSGNGNHIVLEHNFNGTVIRTLYSHLENYNGCPAVGQSVGKGTVIGTMGNTGNSSAPHLHFSIYSGKTTDPIGYASSSGTHQIYDKQRNLTFYDPEYVISKNALP